MRFSTDVIVARRTSTTLNAANYSPRRRRSNGLRHYRATTDFKQRTELVPAPTTLKPGFYFIIASHDKDFSERENHITYADVWVSELALVVRPHNQRIEGFVLVAGSGEPVSRAEVMSWHLDDQGNRVPTSPAISTDTNGFFSFPSKEYRGSLLRVRAKIGGVQHAAGWARVPH